MMIKKFKEALLHHSSDENQQTQQFLPWDFKNLICQGATKVEDVTSLCGPVLLFLYFCIHLLFQWPKLTLNMGKTYVQATLWSRKLQTPSYQVVLLLFMMSVRADVLTYCHPYWGYTRFECGMLQCLQITSEVF